jgi:predicted ATPase/class 3 adenylate cyclase
MPTFLFTDIEGSTTLWERAPDAMKAALARHDRWLREAIASHGGRIVKTTGDGVMAVFDAPVDALRACIEAQRALQAPATGDLALKVRMGLHTGEADERDGDYFGAAPTRAARVMAAAYGGQVLVSAATTARLREGALDGATLRDLGEHRLKGLSASERLAQVVADGLRDDFPPLASQAGHNLPAERDAFVGRRDVLDAVRKRFDDGARLVSVLAIGGAGKTRVVARYGHDALGEHPGGVWFCDLTPARSQDGIVQAVAQGLDVALGKEDPVAQLGHAIAGRGRCLVILDNFEQVAGHAAATVGAWLDRAGAARFLVATRESLGLPGEQVVVVPPLGRAEAIELFRRRAQAVQASRTSGPDDDAALEKLVDMLDGLPLAIELAAARIGVMSPRAMLGRMSERFKLLASSRGRTDRQAALRATFDWSWDLLTPAEKSALAQLSVFEGGFTLDAAEAVVDVAALDDAPWPADLVQSLLHKSLVRRAGDDRFDLLVSVREYAAGQLIALGGAAAKAGAEQRHGAHYATLDERAIVDANGVELDNLVAACRRAVARGDTGVAVGALSRAWAALHWRGPFRVATDLAAQVRTIASDAASRGTVAWVAGSATMSMGAFPEARARLESALRDASEAGDRRLEGEILTALGRVLAMQGRMSDAQLRLDTALAIALERREPELECRVRQVRAQVEHSVGRSDAARTELGAALTLAREIGDRRRLGRVLCDLGKVCADAGPLEHARRYYEQALVAARETDDRGNECVLLCNLGLVQQLEGRWLEARDTEQAGLALARELGHLRVEPTILCNLGIVSERLGDHRGAREHLDAGHAIALDIGDVRSEGLCLGYLGALLARERRIAEAREHLARARHKLEAMDDATSVGIMDCLSAETEHYAGDREAARRALEAAATGAVAVAAGPDSELGLELARVRSLLG